jgi:hypothetical protein
LRAVVDLRAVVFFAAVFFFAADFFFAPDFFFDEALLDDVDPERELELRELEREEDLVRAGMAETISALSSLPISSIESIDGSLHEPTLGVLDASPVSLQSSWAINDLLSRIARARFPTTFVSTVQRERTTSSARC